MVSPKNSHHNEMWCEFFVAMHPKEAAGGRLMEQKNRRKGIVIMGQLIGLVKPLLPVMCVAVLLGVLGYLCAIFLTILAGYGLLAGIGNMTGMAPGTLAAVLILLAVLRGVLHYGEQYCNHFIAFKLLAIIRHRV